MPTNKRLRVRLVRRHRNFFARSKAEALCFAFDNAGVALQAMDLLLELQIFVRDALDLGRKLLMLDLLAAHYRKSTVINGQPEHY